MNNEKKYAPIADAPAQHERNAACLSFTPGREKNSTSRSFQANHESYPPLCGFVMDFARTYTDNRKCLNDIELSLGEIFSNIAFYSSEDGTALTDVTVALSKENDTLCIEFSDNGIPFNPLDRPKPSLEENRKNKVVGGFGIYMVTQLMDDVSYRYEDKNILTLKKKLLEETV